MAKKQKNIELYIPSILGYEKVAMDSVAAAAEIMGFHKSRIEDLRTAISEACTNAMEHGNRLRKNTKVLVSLEIGKKSLEVKVKDEGKGFRAKAENPDIDAQIDSEAENRGWGVFLIKNLVDEVEFQKVPEGGNVTRMVIHVTPNIAS